MSRKILVMTHTGRPEAKDAARQSCAQLHSAGLVPVLSRPDLEALCADGLDMSPVEILEEDVALKDIEIVMVLGGDGSILRAAELVRGVDTPLLGVNLGHVGFLAESERSGLNETVEAIVDGRYTVERRMALDVTVWEHRRKVLHTWALNEASVEKGDREKMIEVVTEVDRRPLSTFGCDGVVMATPTGSTAYAFSAGGPVVWPEVEALLMVPLSAHALFSRPLVISPRSMLAVEVLTRTDARGVLWCDGRRTVDLPPGSRIEVRRSEKSVNLARMHATPFSERLVKKFELPIAGWRGPRPGEQVESMTTALPMVQPTTVVAQDLSQPKLSVGREIPHHGPRGRGGTCTPDADDLNGTSGS
ncbi:NAD kinase [Kocuria rhizophila]|uniref:NAD kinase n=1 Tax=Kocuria rhizophila TaxID=72000 RepID=UPI000C7CAE20|nr:NAD kinase [Kocuria rhizophila]MDR7374039.1 NAD+ kinase [Kocuria rhizophila]PKZ37282.1 NAD kinase [Kocuria rhizophila]RLP59703.1 NAD kinase [Kocuria rhizophila]